MVTLERPTSTAAALHRLRQGCAAMLPARRDEREAMRSARLTLVQAATFASLPDFDRRHLCRVFNAVRWSGVDDIDLLQAALLHDIGKRSPDGQVRLVHRALRVLLGRLAPRLLHRLAQLPAPGWRHGLALAVHHPTLGAEIAAQLGCSPRTCWLIQHHEDRPAPKDDGLARLIAYDERTP